jgi:hypothetical protein
LEDEYREKLVREHDLQLAQPIANSPSTTDTNSSGLANNRDSRSSSNSCDSHNSTAAPHDPFSHVVIQNEVIASFIQNRDGGYTAWKYKKHPIVNRNQTFYKYANQ